MIYDRIENINSYKGISSRLDKALELMESGEIFDLKPGIHKIEGDNLRVHINDYNTCDRTELKYEAHRRFIDIQLTADGTELCGYKPLPDLKPADGFDESSDIGFYEEDNYNGLFFTLSPESFMLLFPQDAHKPGCHDGDKAGTVRKIVIKVSVG